MVFAGLKLGGTNLLSRARFAGQKLHGFATNAHRFATQKLIPGLKLASNSLEYATKQAGQSDLFNAKQKENARKLNDFVASGVTAFGKANETAGRHLPEIGARIQAFNPQAAFA